MKAHDWFIEHRPDFFAGALEPSEEKLFRDHLARCIECREAVTALELDLRWLPMGVAPVPPRPGFTQSVVQELTARRPRRSHWMGPALAAAVVLVAVGLWQSDRARIDGLARDLAAMRDTISVLRAKRVVQMPIVMDGKQGGMVIFADERTHRWNVVVHGLPPAPRGERYTFWFVTADGMVRGPDVVLDEQNPAVMTLDMPPGARQIKGGALTVEPMNPASSLPEGKELAHFEL